MTTPDPPDPTVLPDRAAAIAVLRWQVEMGADEAVGDAPWDRFAPEPAALPSASAPARASDATPASGPALWGERAHPLSTRMAPAQPVATPEPLAEAALAARQRAAGAETLAELGALVDAFEGCPLRRTATNTVFCDGNLRAHVMVIGEGPGAEEDRSGRPFVGRSGQLLDRMLGAIGLDRNAPEPEKAAHITNVIYWRPPGNRRPTAAEIASCLPFVLRHIALVAPKVLVLCGGAAASALLPVSEGIMRLRGRWLDLAVPGLARPLPVLPIYHPSFLLRTPERKREAWRDLLALEARLAALQAEDPL